MFLYRGVFRGDSNELLLIVRYKDPDYGQTIYPEMSRSIEVHFDEQIIAHLCHRHGDVWHRLARDRLIGYARAGVNLFRISRYYKKSEAETIALIGEVELVELEPFVAELF